MTDRLIPASALTAALDLPKPVDTLGYSLFLYADLLEHAGPGGTVIRTRAKLATDLATSESRVDAWVARLAGVGLIRVQSPSPYLVIQIRFWSDHEGGDAPKGNNPAIRSEKVHKESYSNAIAVQKTIGDRGLGEGGLIAMAREILGDAAEVELHAILRTHDPDRVARVLQRVRTTPSEKIRKSKVAFFRYLIAHDKP